MDYRDFEIEILKDDSGFRARATRKDNRRFTIQGSDYPYLLLPYAETAFAYATEDEAVAEVKAIVANTKV